MFTSKDFTRSLTALFGNKDDRANLQREAIHGIIEHAHFHAQAHGNSTPWTQIHAATEKGGGLRSAFRTVLAAYIPARVEIPKGTATSPEVKAFRAQCEEVARETATELTERIYSVWNEARKLAAEKREEKKAEAELAERAAAEERDAAIAAAISKFVLSGPEGVVELSSDEFHACIQYVTSIRDGQIKKAA